ncbi:D-alanyl-lipoteichoic acid acyltransferase DltB (MBOAT superfamily) [Anaeroplasma bactoclasticum]|uniref:D-alanyl-lipoteichoic acid acyltransferase DltB (MBOAT superfamily) n=2 Tax=Anaeroplasma bactoclasticum TaxID=2088 RepID=A0A397R2L4_9MOLU|nr:D-alanyl-lipoteichoic acid acyltransferase DltB (MBOAT superfamily) [Anaeroplasma bactoclasticum]
MSFNSLEFLIFLPIVFILYFIFPKKYRYFILLIASYVFYMWWNWKLIFLILITTLVSYTAGIGIRNTDKIAIKRLLMILSITVSLGILIFFKYANFIVESFILGINSLGGGLTFDAINIILPVGISFYTFQTLSYVIDIYKGKIEAEENPFYYALYVSFFPQLVAGPIERSGDLLPQLKNKEGNHYQNLSIGLKQMLVGFIKKIAIADMVAVYVNNIFNNIDNTNGLLVLVGTILFSIQILCDFSGYSDIAIGCARCFNIKLSKNFDKPYSAISIKDFWNRWHITLSTWFRDYVYFPMGGSRVNKVRLCINILVVFLLSGIWHGAAWTFILWGLMHGIMRIIGQLIEPLREKAYNKWNINKDSIFIKIIRISITYILVSLTWIAFRSNSLAEMATAYRLLFSSWNLNGEYFNTFKNILNMPLEMAIYIPIAILGLKFIDLIRIEFKESKMTPYVLRKVLYTVLILLVMGCFIYQKSSNIESAFIYFQF